MPGCCIGALVLFLGPRVVLFFAWLMSDWYQAFDSRWIAVLGWLLLPFTSLAWIYTHFRNDGRLEGGYVVLLVVAVIVDLISVGSSERVRRAERH